MSRVVDIGNGTTVEIFADGTRVQRMADGTTLQMCTDGTKIQTTQSGVKLVVRPDGSRLQTQPNGISLETFPDGRTIQKSLDGTIIELHPDKRRIQTNPDGTVIRVSPNGQQIHEFPTGQRLKVDKDGKVTELSSANSEERPTSPSEAPPSKPSTSGNDKDRARNRGRKKHAGAAQDGRHRKVSAAHGERSRRGKSPAPHGHSPRDRERVKALQARVADLELALLDNESAHKKELEELNARAKKDGQKVLALEAQLAEANTQHDKKVSQMKRDNKARVDGLLEQVKSLESAVEKASANAKGSGHELQSKAIELETSLAGAEATIRTQKETISQLKEKLNGVLHQLDEVRSGKGAADDVTKALEERIHMLEIQKQALESQVEDLIYKGGTVAEHVMELKNERDELDAKAQQAFDLVASLREELASNIAQMTSDAEALSNALKDVARMAERAAKGEVLESKLSSLVEEKVRLEERVSELSKRATGGNNSQVSKLNKQLNVVEDKLEVALKEKDFLESQVTRLTATEAKVRDLEERLAEATRSSGMTMSVIPEIQSLRRTSTAPTSTKLNAGGLLADIAGGNGARKLKKTSSQASNTSQSRAKPAASTNSIAELCQLKAQQRATRASQIEKLINKGKE